MLVCNKAVELDGMFIYIHWFPSLLRMDFSLDVWIQLQRNHNNELIQTKTTSLMKRWTPLLLVISIFACENSMQVALG